jgi:PQQ-like domain
VNVRVIAAALCLATACAADAPRSTTRSAGTAPAANESPALDGRVIDSAMTGMTVSLLTCDTECGSSDSPAASSGEVVAVDAKTGEMRWISPVASPLAIAADGAGVWVATFLPSTVVRLNPNTGKSEVTTGLSLSSAIVPGDDAFLPSDITIGESAVWVSTARGQLDRIDPTTGDVVAEIPLPPETTGGVAAGVGGAWVAEGIDGVDRIDTSANRAIDTIPITRGDSRLWVDEVAVVEGHLLASGVWAKSITDETGSPDYQSTGQRAVASIDSQTATVAATVELAKGFEFHAESGAAWVSSRSSFAQLLFTKKSASVGRRVNSTGVVVGISEEETGSWSRAILRTERSRRLPTS